MKKATKDIILYEDNDLIVINKPYGLVVNESKTTKSETLQELISKTNVLNLDIEGDYVTPEGYDKKQEFLDRQGIVHRLDADTSGNLIIAKNIDSFIALQDQFKTRIVKKGYYAITTGNLVDVTIGENFTIDAPIGRNPKSRHKFAIIEDTGKDAITEFSLIDKFSVKDKNSDEISYYSILECFPLTGRTHQIRVHLSAMNVPVLGDKNYAGNSTRKKFLKFPDHLSRLYLHAFYIKFNHPKTNIELEIVSEKPAEFAKVVEYLKT